MLKRGTVAACRRRHGLMGLVVAALLAASLPAQAASVEDVRFGLHEQATRVVLDLSERNDYRIFTLDQPYRVVIDLPGARWNVASRAGADTTAPGRGLVRGYRQARYRSDMHRVVLDVTDPVALDQAFQIDRGSGPASRLVVDLREISARQFRRKGRQMVEAEAGERSSPDTRDGDQRQAAREDGSAVPVPERNPRQSDTRVVVIDAGHGGRDPGAIGVSGTYEKTVTLRAAKRLRDRLQRRDQYSVVLTRETDRFLPLRKRVRLARQHNSDLFISLHADAHPESDVRGASVYTLSDTASDEEAARLARRENRAGAMSGMGVDVANEQVANILIDLVQRTTMNRSRGFATRVANRLDERTLTLDDSRRSAGFVVLKAPDVPSVLVEMGYLSNPRDERKLRRNAHLTRLTEGIARAIDGFFEDSAQVAGRQVQ